MGVVAKSITLKLLKRIPFPIFRWDIWPFILLFYPIFIYVVRLPDVSMTHVCM